MKKVPETLQPEFDRLLAGDLDGLSADDVARLESLLNRDGAAADKLAQVKPPKDFADLDPVLTPSDTDWRDVWERIDGARHDTIHWRRLRVWEPISAAAAAVLLAVGLWLGRPATMSDGWSVQWAHDLEVTELMATGDAEPLVGAEAWPVAWASDVEVQTLEAGDDVLPLMIQAGGDDGVPVIWAVPT